MAHFAKVVSGTVTQVIVAEPEFFETFVDTSPGEWIQTSYNTRGGVHYQANSNEPSEDQTKALRKNYAGIGYTTMHKEMHLFHQNHLTLGCWTRHLACGKHQLHIQMMEKDIPGMKQQLLGIK